MRAFVTIAAALLLATTATASEPTATILIHETFFHKLTESLLPVINTAARNLVIPGQTEKHFSFADIKLSEFDLGNLTITFASPNKIMLGLRGLSLQVPQTHFDVYTRIIFKISCGGYFDVSLSGTNIDIEVDVNEQNGRLQIVAVTPTVTFGSLNVYHRFHSGLCRVGQDIIQLLLGNIDNLIRKLVEKDIAPLLGKAVEGALTKMAAKLPVDLAQPPAASPAGLEIVLDLLKPSAVPPAAVAFRRRPVPLAALLSATATALRLPAPLTTVPNRDIEIWTSQASVNGLLAHAEAAGTLDINKVLPPSVNTTLLRSILPLAYAACPGCPLEIEIDFQTAPAVAFQGNVSITVQQAIFGVNAQAPNRTVVPLLDLLLNLTAGVGNWRIGGNESNTIHFDLSVQTFTLGLYRSNVGNVDVALISGIVGFLLKNVLVPDFNAHFPGITIPGGAVRDIAVNTTGGQAGFGLDVFF